VVFRERLSSCFSISTAESTQRQHIFSQLVTEGQGYLPNLLIFIESMFSMVYQQ